MRWATARTEGSLDDARRDVLDAAVRAQGGSSVWRENARARRSYALLELPDGPAAFAALVEAATASGATVYHPPVIALALFPAVPEALPPLLLALGAEGRPAGVRSCEPCNGGAIVEWDLDRTPVSIVLGIADVELARFRSGRTIELLTPLSPEWRARIAANGLRAPEISPDRVLETLIERSGLSAGVPDA